MWPYGFGNWKIVEGTILDVLSQGLGQKREYCAKCLRKFQYAKTTRDITFGNGVIIIFKRRRSVGGWRYN